MAFVNYNNREITAKIVYYGPALSGKTTCLRFIYGSQEIENKGKLITLDTDGDRTLFFDFLPLEIGKLGTYSIKIQLYTVPGQVSYDTTRKLVLQGADGIVFVADSQVVAREMNIEAFSNLKKNLKLNNIVFNETPLIFQFNKRDLREILPIDILNKDLNSDNRSFFPTIAVNGENVLEGLHAIIKLVIISLKNKLSIFQKDKTVMFSRDEITAATPVPTEKKEEPLEETDVEVVPPPEPESEDIFELSSPLTEKPQTKPEPQEEDEIFQLENPKEEEKSATPVPTFDLDDIPMPSISYETQPVMPPSQERAMKAPPAPAPSRSSPQVPENKTIEVPPIRLEVPDFKDSITLSVHLSITLKKGKKP